MKIKIDKNNIFKLAIPAAAVLAAAAFIYLCVYYLGAYSYANPKVFYLAAPLFFVCLAAAYIKYKYRPALKYPLPEGVAKTFSLRGFLANWLGFILICPALFLCLTALARPRIEGRTIIPPAEGVDIILTIDISRSMTAVDFVPDRITAAKNTAREFVKKRNSDRIGVVVFEDFAQLQTPLTLDYFAVIEYIDMINLDMLGGQGGTAIGDAIALSTEHLVKSPAKSRVIILLTDGENNSGAVDPMAAAKAAQAYGIKIYTIAVSAEGQVQRPVESVFGTVKYVPMDPISAEGEALLMEIAKMTGGDFFRARNNLDLQNIYSRIDSLEKTEFDETAQINYTERYRPFLTAALILLVLSFVTDKFIFIKIP